MICIERTVRRIGMCTIERGRRRKRKHAIAIARGIGLENESEIQDENREKQDLVRDSQRIGRHTERR